MNQSKLIEDIKRLKKEKKAVFLVHNYQIGEIQDLADYLGDSLGLSKLATEVDNPLIVFCGVKFMAETAKILSPDKKVLIPRMDAGCPMADMVDVDGLKKMKAEHPDATVVTYVNSTAEVKAESDICVTSANAVKVVQNLKTDKIIFTPDKNLAAWVQRFTDKTIIPWDGYCYVHQQYTAKEMIQAKEKHSDGVLIVHPECPAEVIDQADEVLSTSGMVQFTKTTSAKKLLIGTEEGMIYRLRKENPNKKIFAAGTVKMCKGMKINHLEDVYKSLYHEQHEMILPATIMDKARMALERMLQYV